MKKKQYTKNKNNSNYMYTTSWLLLTKMLIIETLHNKTNSYKFNKIADIISSLFKE